jgi:hypothetical protein
MTVFKAMTLAVMILLLSNVVVVVQSFQQPASTWTTTTTTGGTTGSIGRTSSTTTTTLYLAEPQQKRRPFISGNWKLNPQTREEAIQLANDIASSVTDTSPNADIALFVPYVFIESTMNVVQNKLMIGAEVSTYRNNVNVYVCVCRPHRYKRYPPPLILTVMIILNLYFTLDSYVGCLSRNSRCFHGCRVGQYVEFIGCTVGISGTFRTTGHFW